MNIGLFNCPVSVLKVLSLLIQEESHSTKLSPPLWYNHVFIIKADIVKSDVMKLIVPLSHCSRGITLNAYHIYVYFYLKI